MIGHEAVSKKREVLLLSSATKLRTDQDNPIGDLEGSMALIRAEGEEISVRPQVVERLEVVRLAGEHLQAKGKVGAEIEMGGAGVHVRVPAVCLTTDWTGPAEAGHYGASLS